jgi:prevent-host-death family protein
MAEHIGIEEARKNLGPLVSRVQYSGAEIILTRNSKPAAMLVPIPQEPAMTDARRWKVTIESTGSEPVFSKTVKTLQHPEEVGRGLLLWWVKQNGPKDGQGQPYAAQVDPLGSGDGRYVTLSDIKDELKSLGLEP